MRIEKYTEATKTVTVLTPPLDLYKYLEINQKEMN